MKDEAVIELRQLRAEFANLVANLSPWVSTDEMCVRYKCTPKTLNNMERDGRIPFRINGKWSRVELLQLAPEVEYVSQSSGPDPALLRLLINSTDAKPLPGVYFLLAASGEVQYIGQSKNVLSRMHGHSAKEFAQVRMIRMDDPGQRLALESNLINLFKPKLNLQFSKVSAL